MGTVFLHQPSTQEEFLSMLGGKDNIMRIVRTAYGDVRIFLKNNNYDSLPRLSDDFDSLTPDSRVWYVVNTATDHFFCSNDPHVYGPLLSFLGQDQLEEQAEVIRFGQYEQGHGAEPVEWMVLDRVQDGPKTKLLVLSLYGLEKRPYNKFEFKTTWESSPLRQWLNSDFMEAAFTPEERSSILLTHVTADEPPRAYRGADPGNDTQDRVFLLSIPEVLHYFPQWPDGLCRLPKAEAVSGSPSETQFCDWWLRTPGYAPYQAALFTSLASIFLDTTISDKHTFVRPAMWIER